MHTQAQALDSIRLENTGVPIYVQLREQFLRAMGQGLLKAGDQMAGDRGATARCSDEIGAQCTEANDQKRHHGGRN